MRTAQMVCSFVNAQGRWIYIGNFEEDLFLSHTFAKTPNI